MKSFLFIPLGICLATTGCYATQPTSKVLLAQAAPQANAQKIAQVKAGTLKTVHASWWGFDKEDATDCLQNAINSGVPKLIVDNTGSDWIINKPLNLVSNQQIIFADGVVIQAKENEFKGKNDSLFSGNKITNISLIGQGKVLFRMHREDYANPKLYEKAEWRNGIDLRDCTNVILRNITVTETGGDGLYLGASWDGYNKNVMVEDMVFDANYRQGISVISAEDLTIRNTKLINTKGTPPQAGIDFEPNGRAQRLVNIAVENCILTGNAGPGIDVATFHFNSTSKPISITITKSLIKGNNRGLTVNPYNPPATTPVVGKITIIDCTFDHNQILLGDPAVGGIQYLLKDCILDVGNTEEKMAGAPIALAYRDLLEERSMGDIVFDNITVIGDVKNAPLSIVYERGSTISNTIGGDIYLKQGNQKIKYDLAGFIKNKQEEFQKLNALQLATIDLNSLQASTTSAPRVDNNQFYLRNDFTFLQYAKKYETINITITSKRIYPRKATIKLIDPNGKTIEVYDIPTKSGSFPIHFTATETGFYRLVRSGESSNYIDINSSHSGNGLLADKPLDFLPTSGKLYFQVPAGVKNFDIGITSDSAADIALLDSSDKEVQRQNNLNGFQIFSGSKSDVSRSEIWSIEVSKAVWAVTISMYQPLIPIVSTNPETLLRKE